MKLHSFIIEHKDEIKSAAALIGMLVLSGFLNTKGVDARVSVGGSIKKEPKPELYSSSDSDVGKAAIAAIMDSADDCYFDSGLQKLADDIYEVARKHHNSEVNIEAIKALKRLSADSHFSSTVNYINNYIKKIALL